MSRAVALFFLAATSRCATPRAACSTESVPPSFASVSAQWSEATRSSLVAIELDGTGAPELLLPSLDRDRTARLAVFSLRDGAWRSVEAFSRATMDPGTFDAQPGLTFVQRISGDSCAQHALFRFDDAQGAHDPRWTRSSIIVFSWVRDELRATLECELESTTVTGPEREETQSVQRTFVADAASITVRDARSSALVARAQWSHDHWIVEPREACATRVVPRESASPNH